MELQSAQSMRVSLESIRNGESGWTHIGQSCSGACRSQGIGRGSRWSI